MNVVKGHWTRQRVTDAIAGLLAHSAFIDDWNDSLNVEDKVPMVAIREIEGVIGRAIAGEAPNPDHWGSLTAPELLQVIHDVTTWSLTNFEAFRMRPATENMPSRCWLAATPFYAHFHRRQPPFASATTVRTLSSVNHPELRCPALWWAHALLSTKGPLDHGLTARQRVVLRSRCPVGLHWLYQRMAHWPQDYVREHWIPLDELF